MSDRTCCDPPNRAGWFWARLKGGSGEWEVVIVAILQDAAVGGRVCDYTVHPVNAFDWGPEVVKPAGLRDGC